MPSDDTPDQGPRYPLCLLGKKYRILKMLAGLGTDFDEDLKRNPLYFREKQVAAHIKVRNEQVWSRLRKECDEHDKGREQISAYQLRLLAEYYKLDQECYLGETAWEYFLDTISVADFEAALMRVGYGYWRRMRKGDDPIQAIIEDLKDFGPRLDGLDIDIVTHATRGLVTPDLLDEQEFTVDLPLEAKVRVKVDLETPSHVVLLDFCYVASVRGIEATVLAPSSKAKTTPLRVGVSVPTEGDAQNRVFVVVPPPERRHLIAFISSEPFELTWPSDVDFSVLTALDLGAFLRTVKCRGPATVSVRHRPYRVVRQ